jgi:predicted DsbA family dithiol-disulfide isomerase
VSQAPTFPAPAARRAVVEVFADIWCPFAYLGLLQAQRVRAEKGLAFDLLVRAWPLELVNGRPQDPEKVVQEATELRDQVAPDRFGGLRVEGFPTTSIPALALGVVAAQAGPALGEAVALALREALFEEGADIGDPAVLAPLAERFGLALPEPERARALVAAEYQDGLARGVRGSPHFFAGQAEAFCPTLQLRRSPEGLQAALHPERLAAWLSGALGAPPRS